MAWIRSIGKTINYNATGLSGYQGRATVVDGGYAMENGTVYVDVTVRMSTNVTSGQDIIQGFPQPSVQSGEATAEHDGLVIKSYSYTPYLETKRSFSSGTTARFVGAYTLRQI